MLAGGESQKGAIRPDFNRAVMSDFQAAKITADVGFLLMREIDERFRIIDPMQDCLEDLRSPTQTTHSSVQMVRQRVYQIADGYEDCTDADYLRIAPALSLRSRTHHIFYQANQQCQPDALLGTSPQPTAGPAAQKRHSGQDR